jgi:hypothetical protein
MSAAGWDFASADNSNVLVNSVSYVPILTKGIVGIAAHDTLLIDIWGTFLNSSGGPRQYSSRVSVGGVSVIDTVMFNVGASTVSRAATVLRFIVSVSSVNAWRAEGVGWITGTIPGGGFSTIGSSFGSWKSGAEALLGTKPVLVQMKSNSPAATQIFTMHSFGIRRIPQVP